MDWIEIDGMKFPSAIPSTLTKTVWRERTSDEGRDDNNGHDYDGDDESKESFSWSRYWLLQDNQSANQSETKRRSQPAFGGQQEQQQHNANDHTKVPQSVPRLPMFRSIWHAYDRYRSISSVSSSNIAV
jgi:hypothetical protein